MPKKDKKSFESVSYKSEEKIFGLTVKVRDNGRESYKPEEMRRIHDEIEQDLSNICEMEK